MPEVFVGAGSNADPDRRLRVALRELSQRFGALRCSSVYRSAASGGIPAPDYLNLVIELETDVAADTLCHELRAIEQLAGRTRADPTVCALDLDLLLYGRRVDAQRKLPRPGLFAAPFVLGPLAELVPQLVHPLTGETCRAAWAALAPGGLNHLGTLRV